MAQLVRLEQDPAVICEPRRVDVPLAGGSAAEIARMCRIGDVEDRGPEVPVGEIGTGGGRVRDHGVHEEADVLARRSIQRRAPVQVATGAPAAYLDGGAGVCDVVDVEAEGVRLDSELSRSQSRVDPRVPPARPEPDLVRAARPG